MVGAEANTNGQRRRGEGTEKQKGEIVEGSKGTAKNSVGCQQAEKETRVRRMLSQSPVLSSLSSSPAIWERTHSTHTQLKGTFKTA